MVGESERRSRVVRFWRAVEVFTPGDVPRVDHGRGGSADRRGEGMYPARPVKPLPWEPGHVVGDVELDPNSTWQHVVYGGVFGLDVLYGRMEKVFGASDVDFDERVPRGDTALFSVVVNAEGGMDLDTLVLSTAAWGLGRADNRGPDDPTWLDGFEGVVDIYRDQVTSLLAEAEAEAEIDAMAVTLMDGAGEGGAGPPTADQDDGPRLLAGPVPAAGSGEGGPRGAREGEVRLRPLRYVDLWELVVLAAQLLGLSELSVDWQVRVQTRRVPRRRLGQGDQGEEGFLNSFHLDDLDRVARAVARADYGRALEAYLTEDDALDVGSRCDVRAVDQRPVVRASLGPARVPMGRWPAKAAHPLAASQQLAVGEIMDRLGDTAGIFGVNGPPGTGKTTMLRDLIAAVVVARAERLAGLPRPGAAFTKTLTWGVDGQVRAVKVLDPSLTGFEMVIASENNGAVENVTRQIPTVSAIEDPWRGRAGYFAEHAERLLKEPAWGLVAAPLGNMANRQRFVKQFWFGDPDPRSRPFLTGSSSTDPAGSPVPGPERVHEGFRDFLQGEVGTPVDWAGEVRAYRKVVAAQERLRADRVRWEQLLIERPGLADCVKQAQACLVKAVTDREAAQEFTDRAARAAHGAQVSERAATAQRGEHLTRRPGTLETVFTWGKAARRWHGEDEPLALELAQARQRLKDAEQTVEEAAQVLSLCGQAVAAAEETLRQDADKLARLEATLRAVAAQWGTQFPDEAWWQDERRRELAGPWLDEAWNAARSEVFLAALQLHAAFITATAGILRRNLDTTAMLLRGQVPRDLAEPVARAAWQTLFLVVPVVSTTFASAPRLFRHLSREALGWLFIDEAGQARPQSAVATIWRCRRVVAVGDPMQLEPVITVLNTTQQALRRHYGVSQTWTPMGTCVQSLVDRLTTMGTWLPGSAQDPVWVGAPLRVHRRCDDPMFSLVNRLAYDQMMVHATPERNPRLTVVDTRWVDVSGPSQEGNWIPAEGEAADQILYYLLHKQGLTAEQIFVISPFRAVVSGLKSRLRGYRGVKVSTVHKTQGQERDVVLLVLGSDPDRPGSRAWAAQKPNLLNVAVSRAKQRLYVVGDHSLWSHQPHFGLLARTLEPHPFTPRQR